MRRLTDIGIAVLAGVVLAPVMAVTSMLVRLFLGRPVLFRQRRAGLRGREFYIVKFRTMRQPTYDGEPDASRQTAMGDFLRRFSLDELPQLWNVLVGDMSLIGPRPTLPEQVVHYTERQRGRLEVRPGITGWAQVQGRNTLSWPERIELDLWYIEHRSLFLDAKILLLTLRALLRPSGITGPGGVNLGFPGDGGAAATADRPSGLPT